MLTAVLQKTAGKHCSQTLCSHEVNDSSSTGPRCTLPPTVHVPWSTSTRPNASATQRHAVVTAPTASQAIM
jgi:hypothetical protein